ncbi:hypothetical protein F5Y01DRAFT_309993 [Xylaria sp. FL0043]|nr:hypothetical protein F5Y01DRAFT_309993 [Xylaria sp. FL0043]
MSTQTPDKKFDEGASAAVPNTDLSDGIYEAPQSSTSNDLGAETAQGISKAPGKVEEDKSDKSITQKIKDTAGAGAMVL